MNTNALKKFSQDARIKLLEQVEAKLEYVLNTDTPELREKSDQVRKLREAITKITKEQLIDKVSYTWFNRFMALRFMDANDYQPIGIRILTPKNGYTLPELLDEAKAGRIPEELRVKTQRIFDLLDGKLPSVNAQNEAYKELLIGACNYLSQVFPFLFERINDYTELLLPDDLTSELSIIQDICDGMTAEDCTEVEIIGWLYQFYISAKKDEVFASKSVVKKEDIPAATQLFTPRWIVEYMVQNTVGKLWLQNRPNSNLRDYMPYFIESPSVIAEDYLKINSVEEIKLLDQACGSGHILVYGFELFYKIYEEEGYNPNEIPELIIKHNLYGFEIDERASQLAALAIMMKARSYHRRFFKKEIEPNILCYKDLALTIEESQETLQKIGIILSEELKHDLTNMQQATNYGSLIEPNTVNNDLRKILLTISKENTSDAFLKYNLDQLSAIIEQLILLGQKYHCIVDNPPYMGSGGMNKVLGDFVKKRFPDSKSDLMACFMEAGLKMLEPKGFLGMINQHSWMFLSSYEKLRAKILKDFFLDTMLHLGPRTFPEINGEVVQNASFTFWNDALNTEGHYYRLIDFKTSDIKRLKTLEFIKKNDSKYVFQTNQKDFAKIPGTPVGYWLSNRSFKHFQDSTKLSSLMESGGRCKTHHDLLYLRFFWEIDQLKIHKKWKLYNKGGETRKWYGNLEYTINWTAIARQSYASSGGLSNQKFWGKLGITWSGISSGRSGYRVKIENSEYASASPTIIVDPEILAVTLGFLNSRVSYEFMKVINPTIQINVGDALKLPLILVEESKSINEIVEDNIRISKLNWDFSEHSLDFKVNELLRIKGQDLEERFDLYKQFWSKNFFQLHKNEEELNRKFLELYGLNDEFTYYVDLEDITILKEEAFIQNNQLIFKNDEVFKQFISFAVGCMFGRYSLDQVGLTLANQGDCLEDYLLKLGSSAENLSFLPDKDNIIPILDDEWFEDDITGRFYTFLKASFGTANFDKNLAFVEECLGKDVRRYFMKDFYADHIKRYKKRPIYWMFSSPKGSFNVLIYMHRYTPDTLNKILNSYLIEYREKLNNRIEHLDHLIVSGSSLEQTKAQKEKDRLKLVLLELQEYERETIRPLAIERINIDLDEGVLVNYNKFGKAIKEVAGLNDKVTKKKVREFDWINTEEIR